MNPFNYFIVWDEGKICDIKKASDIHTEMSGAIVICQDVRRTARYFSSCDEARRMAEEVLDRFHSSGVLGQRIKDFNASQIKKCLNLEAHFAPLMIVSIVG